jgi:hypothetical protein
MRWAAGAHRRRDRAEEPAALRLVEPGLVIGRRVIKC